MSTPIRRFSPQVSPASRELLDVPHCHEIHLDQPHVARRESYLQPTASYVAMTAGNRRRSSSMSSELSLMDITPACQISPPDEGLVAGPHHLAPGKRSHSNSLQHTPVDPSGMSFSLYSHDGFVLEVPPADSFAESWSMNNSRRSYMDDLCRATREEFQPSAVRARRWLSAMAVAKSSKVLIEGIGKAARESEMSMATKALGRLLVPLFRDYRRRKRNAATRVICRAIFALLMKKRRRRAADVVDISLRRHAITSLCAIRRLQKLWRRVLVTRRFSTLAIVEQCNCALARTLLTKRRFPNVLICGAVRRFLATRARRDGFLWRHLLLQGIEVNIVAAEACSVTAEFQDPEFWMNAARVFSSRPQ